MWTSTNIVLSSTVLISTMVITHMEAEGCLIGSRGNICAACSSTADAEQPACSRSGVLTCSTLTQLCLHLDGFEAALPFGDILLWVEDDDVDLRYVEHSQRDRGAEAEGHRQRGGLDVHLKGGVAATPGGGVNCPVKHQRKEPHGQS